MSAPPTHRAVAADRASAVLFHFLESNGFQGAFLLPVNVCPVVPLTFVKAGVPFEYLDIEPGSRALDLSAALARVEAEPRRYAGLLNADVYGRRRAVPPELLLALRRASPGFCAIEDRCLGWWDEPEGEADLYLHSFGYAKLVDLGGGGVGHVAARRAYAARPLPPRAAVSRSFPELSEILPGAADALARAGEAWLGGEAPGTPEELRLRYDAALPGVRAHKTRLNAIYDAAVPERFRLGPGWNDWRYQVLFNDASTRDAFLAELRAAGLYASAHYAPLAGRASAREFPRATALAARVANLFNDHHYTEEQAQATAALLARRLS